MARTIINRANVYIVQGEFAQAATTLEGALEFSCEPSLALMVRHNLIDILAKSGRALEASRLFDESRELYLQFSDPLTTSRTSRVSTQVGAHAMSRGDENEAGEPSGRPRDVDINAGLPPARGPGCRRTGRAR